MFVLTLATQHCSHDIGRSLSLIFTDVSNETMYDIYNISEVPRFNGSSCVSFQGVYSIYPISTLVIWSFFIKCYPVRRLKPVNTGSHKHVAEMLKNVVHYIENCIIFSCRHIKLNIFCSFTNIIISNPKQPSCKKKCAALRKAMVKKDVKSKVAAKKCL